MNYTHTPISVSALQTGSTATPTMYHAAQPAYGMQLADPSSHLPIHKDLMNRVSAIEAERLARLPRPKSPSVREQKRLERERLGLRKVAIQELALRVSAVEEAWKNSSHAVQLAWFDQTSAAQNALQQSLSDMETRQKEQDLKMSALFTALNLSQQENVRLHDEIGALKGQLKNCLLAKEANDATQQTVDPMDGQDEPLAADRPTQPHNVLARLATLEASFGGKHPCRSATQDESMEDVRRRIVSLESAVDNTSMIAEQQKASTLDRILVVEATVAALQDRHRSVIDDAQIPERLCALQKQVQMIQEKVSTYTSQTHERLVVVEDLALTLKADMTSLDARNALIAEQISKLQGGLSGLSSAQDTHALQIGQLDTLFAALFKKFEDSTGMLAQDMSDQHLAFQDTLSSLRTELTARVQESHDTVSARFTSLDTTVNGIQSESDEAGRNMRTELVRMISAEKDDLIRQHSALEHGLAGLTNRVSALGTELSARLQERDASDSARFLSLDSKLSTTLHDNAEESRSMRAELVNMVSSAKEELIEQNNSLNNGFTGLTDRLSAVETIAKDFKGAIAHIERACLDLSKRATASFEASRAKHVDADDETKMPAAFVMALRSMEVKIRASEERVWANIGAFKEDVEGLKAGLHSLRRKHTAQSTPSRLTRTSDTACRPVITPNLPL